MSYDLYFWRQTPDVNIAPNEIADRVNRDELVEGLVELSIGDIKKKFVEMFPEIQDGTTDLEWEGAGSYFQVTWPIPANALIVTCGYKLLESPETMNQIIDVAAAFGCALYDPQTGERYQQPDVNDE